jgi:RND family efflux transporter MFP subunit
LLLGVLIYETSRAQAEQSPAPSAGKEAKKSGVFAEGRVVAPAGSDITLAAETGGRIAQLLSAEFSQVKAGDVLIQLDSRRQTAALAEARARLGEIKVELAFFLKQQTRAVELQKRGTVAVVELDKANFDADAARARLATVSASIARLQRDVDETRIVTPISGVVTAVHQDVGEVIQAGDPLLTVVDLSQLELEVEVGEFDIARVHRDAVAAIAAEGFEGQTWQGKVLEIPGWVTSRRLKPLDPGRPSDTRILPVKVSLPHDHPLKLGQRVEVEVKDASSRTR